MGFDFESLKATDIEVKRTACEMIDVNMQEKHPIIQVMNCWTHSGDQHPLLRLIVLSSIIIQGTRSSFFNYT